MTNEAVTYQGPPCKRGHSGIRYKICHGCVQCRLDANNRRKANDPQGFNAARKRYREKHSDKIKAQIREWGQQNRKQKTALAAAYKARKRQAIPPWADLEKIKEIYRNCPEGYEVDHIVPLAHPLMCGLHVENNLQYLTPLQNASKGNRFVG